MDDIDNVLNGINTDKEPNPNQKIDDLVSQSAELGPEEEYDLSQYEEVDTSMLEETIEYPKQLADTELERKYLGLLLNEIKAISVYNFDYEHCYFADDTLLNIYKKIIFTDGERYTPVRIKEKFNFSRETHELYLMKNALKEEYETCTDSMEDVYRELSKIFILRKSFLEIPVKALQARIVDILNYELYDKMTPEDVEAAVNQVTTTQKFKRAVLNKDLTEFLNEGDNTLTNGLLVPFPILTKALKGIRIGETSAYCMPSNYGKSRFMLNLAAFIAVVHKKKVLVISNEMSLEKMKLCLITTIVNNPIMQRLHGHKLHVSENQLLDFRFRPDEGANEEVNSDGFMFQAKGESREAYIKRLEKNSKEYKEVCEVTDWFNAKLYNSIHFIDITDHTNDELRKVIMNYYFKEQVHYVFYDTMKTDIDNIGNGEELKKTATILSNLAQNYHMYICSTMQMQETATDPVNLSVNDLAVSRTVKEVLDNLMLFKQVHRENLDDYEFSKTELFEEVESLKHFSDPNVRYYVCVIDKNRAGPKPVLLYRLNLAYNYWEELGYIRHKSGMYTGL